MCVCVSGSYYRQFVGIKKLPEKEPQVEDSVQLFTSDTLKGGAKKPELVKVLCGNSGPDVPRPRPRPQSG
jgi:hypothetical protein